MLLIREILYTGLWLFFVALLARLVFDFVLAFAREWTPSGIVLVAVEAVFTVTDPPLKALRRVIPPLRIGQIALDLSFIVLILGVQFAMAIVR